METFFVLCSTLVVALVGRVKRVAPCLIVCAPLENSNANFEQKPDPKHPINQVTDSNLNMLTNADGDVSIIGTRNHRLAQTVDPGPARQSENHFRVPTGDLGEGK